MRKVLLCIFYLLLSINVFLYLPLFYSSNITCHLFNICDLLMYSEKLFVFSFVYILLLPVFFTKTTSWIKISMFFLVILLCNILFREDTQNDYLGIGPIPVSIYIYLLFVTIMFFGLLIKRRK